MLMTIQKCLNCSYHQKRAEKFRERHRVIIRDSNKQWREFIINWVQDTMDGYTEIECIASYLADITTAKPYAPGKFEKRQLQKH